ncbi:biotin--[acetyl-CoA-carboxylase] ligase [Natroniella sp. ANB-PHB2]|uniref:biotin--[acetyl-CoA-carboxylase] ligase n=1 Tax=Natroniella sp. ANB-PHB2 TaxID=3384444 RepID=UPI0038D35D61
MRKNLNRREQVLDLLYQFQDQYLSGEELSNKLGVSRTTIWKYIKYFREAGYEIESSSKVGYRLLNRPDKLLPEEIKRNLTTEIIGQNILYYQQVDSTNQIARKKAEEGAKEGTLVIAERQVAGKGRLSRDYFSPQGGIWFSCILRPGLKPAWATRVTYIISLAVAKTINQLTTVEAKIKWPNDILINDRKVCGLLTEMGAELDQVDYLVVGSGINLNFPLNELPQQIHTKATTLYSELEKKVDRLQFIQRLLLEIETYYQQLTDFDTILAEWEEYAYTLGKEVVIKDIKRERKGIAVEIAPDGALVIESNGKREKVYSGDVSLSHQEFDSGN